MTKPLEHLTVTTILRCHLAAALLALVGVAGSLWLSLGMQLKACPLCLYQRAFIMAAAGTLIVGLMSELRRSAMLSLLALPAVIGGLGVSGFHEYLEQTGKLECPPGILGIGTAPQQSLTLFILVLIPLLIPSIRRPFLFAAAALLGLAFAYATVRSAPPPVLPLKPYDKPPDMCRVPYQAPK